MKDARWLVCAVIALMLASGIACATPFGPPEEGGSWYNPWYTDAWNQTAIQMDVHRLAGSLFAAGTDGHASMVGFTQAGWHVALDSGNLVVAQGPSQVAANQFTYWWAGLKTTGVVFDEVTWNAAGTHLATTRYYRLYKKDAGGNPVFDSSYPGFSGYDQWWWETYRPETYGGDPASVPEPMSCALLALACGGIGTMLKRRRSK